MTNCKECGVSGCRAKYKTIPLCSKCYQQKKDKARCIKNRIRFSRVRKRLKVEKLWEVKK